MVPALPPAVLYYILAVMQVRAAFAEVCNRQSAAKYQRSQEGDFCIHTNVHCCVLQCILAEAANASLHVHQTELLLYVIATRHAKIATRGVE